MKSWQQVFIPCSVVCIFQCSAGAVIFLAIFHPNLSVAAAEVSRMANFQLCLPWVASSFSFSSSPLLPTLWFSSVLPFHLLLLLLFCPISAFYQPCLPFHASPSFLLMSHPLTPPNPTHHPFLLIPPPLFPHLSQVSSFVQFFPSPQPSSADDHWCGLLENLLRQPFHYSSIWWTALPWLW